MNSSNLQYVADNIRRLREKRRYTQQDIGARLGIGQNAYSKIESGYSKLTVRRFLEIAEILVIDIEILLKVK